MFWLLPVIGCQHSSSGGDWSGEKNPPNENPSVVSRWVNSNEDYKEILTFYDDGTYTYEKYEKDVLTEGQKGTYSGDISSDEETKLTATEDYSNGEWGNTTSGGGFYVKITGDSIEVVVWWTDNDGMEKKGENSSFSSETTSSGSSSGENSAGTGNSSSSEITEYDFIGDVAGAAEYISSLTDKGTYSVKVVDEKTTSCSALKTALYDIGDSGIYVSLDLSESIINFTTSSSLGNYSSKYNYALVSVVLPDNCTEIGSYSFQYCSSLTSVTIPSSVTEIGYRAFGYCSSLVSITIPEDVTKISSYAFYYCSSLESITIPEGVSEIGSNTFYYCSSLKSVTIPKSITEIGSYAFYYCSSLESVIIPSTVTSIGSVAFGYCSSLESITIPEGITEIAQSLFRNCSSLKFVTIPSSITEIGSYAFYHCSPLESVTIPENVTYIGRAAFDSTSLTQAVFEDTEGWTRIYIYDETEYEEIESSVLQDSSQAAHLLKASGWHDWTKTTE